MSPLNACDTRCCPAKGFWQFLTSSCSFCLVACRWKEWGKKRQSVGQTDREGVTRRPSLWKCFVPSSILLSLRRMCRRGKRIRPHICGGKLGAVGFLHASKHGPGGAARTHLLLGRRIPLAWQQGEAACPQDLQGPSFFQPAAKQFDIRSLWGCVQEVHGLT